MEGELSLILRNHPALTLINDGKRIKCSLTGHEMPLRVDAVLAYITNRKYKRLCDLQQSTEYEKYKAHLVPSNKEGYKHQLFCLLTLRHVSNDRKQVEQHLAGRRFQKAYARWLLCQATGERFTARISRKAKSKIEDDDDDDGQPGSKRKGRSDKMWAPEVGGGDDDDVSDTFSDLYPAADFQQLDLNDEWSDYEFEAMDEDGASKDSNAQAASQPSTKNKKISVPARQEKRNKRHTGQQKPKFLKESKAKRPKT